jgi:hypothetical protein
MGAGRGRPSRSEPAVESEERDAEERCEPAPTSNQVAQAGHDRVQDGGKVARPPCRHDRRSGARRRCRHGRKASRGSPACAETRGRRPLATSTDCPSSGRHPCPSRSRSSSGVSSRPAPLASGQAVRRLTLDQEIEGSNPSSPANILSVKYARRDWREGGWAFVYPHRYPQGPTAGRITPRRARREYGPSDRRPA